MVNGSWIALTGAEMRPKYSCFREKCRRHLLRRARGNSRDHAAVADLRSRADVAFERGEGPYHFLDGRASDFSISAPASRSTRLGHAHPHLVAALTTQAAKLWHTSNLYQVPGQQRLAERLVAATFADTVFFGNSGAEALECSIKMARKYHATRGEPQRYRIITFEGAFHGRTLATIAAGGQKKYLEGFGPKVEGFDQVPFGDHRGGEGCDRARDRRHPDRADPGRGRRARPFGLRFLRELRALCDEHGMLLDARRGAERHRAHRQALRA